MTRLSILLGSAFVMACSAAAPTEPSGTPFDSETGSISQIEGKGPQSQGVRKLTIDELAASVPIAAGPDVLGEPIRWRVDHEGEMVDAFDPIAFGRILGRPDYVTLTEENPAPTAVYTKFARDMAREVCDAMVQNDISRTSEPTLWRFAPHTSAPSDAEVTANVKYLVLRFLSLRIEEGDELLDRYRKLYRAAEINTKGPLSTAQVEGWRAVCIGLFEDPAFHVH